MRMSKGEQEKRWTGHPPPRFEKSAKWNDSNSTEPDQSNCFGRDSSEFNARRRSEKAL